MDEVTIEAGDLLLRHDHEVRVMAVAEKWVMMRRKGCAPFLVHLSACQGWPIAKRAQRPKGWKLAETMEAQPPHCIQKPLSGQGR